MYSGLICFLTIREYIEIFSDSNTLNLKLLLFNVYLRYKEVLDLNVLSQYRILQIRIWMTVDIVQYLNGVTRHKSIKREGLYNDLKLM